MNNYLLTGDALNPHGVGFTVIGRVVTRDDIDDEADTEEAMRRFEDDADGIL